MVQRRVIPIDEFTGKPVEGSFTISQYVRAPAALARGGFLMVSQDEQMDALIQADVGYEAMRVFLILLTMVDYENWIHVHQDVVGRRAGVSRPNVSRAIVRLVDAGVLIRGPKVGRFGTLRLNPSFGWKGKSHGHRGAVIEFEKARQARPLTDVELKPRSEVDVAEVYGLEPEALKPAGG